MSMILSTLFVGDDGDAVVETVTPAIGTLKNVLPTVRITNNRARRSASTEDSIGTPDSGSLPTANYLVRATARYLGGDSTAQMQLFARYQDVGNLYGVAIKANGDLEMYKAVGFAFETLESVYSIPGFSVNTDYEVALSVNEDSLSVLLNGSVVIGPVTDIDIAEPRVAVLHFDGNVAANEATTGWHAESWSVEDFAPDDPELSIEEQPTATQSGYLIDPAPVVHVLDAEGALDTSFTGDVTASLLGSGGVLLGTLTVAAVAGVATFSNLRPCEAGSYQLRFSATGYANLDSAVFAVTAGEGSTNVIVHQEAPMRPIRRNEPTAALRDIPITILADDGSPWDGDPDAGDGVKAMLSQNFGEETASPANIVKIAEGDFRVRPTDAYTDIAEGSIIKARVPAAAGRRQAFGYAHIIPNDSYVSADAARKALVDAVIIASDGGNGYDVVKQPESNQIQRTIPGVGVVTITAVFSPSVPGIVSAGGS